VFGYFLSFLCKNFERKFQDPNSRFQTMSCLQAAVRNMRHNVWMLEFGSWNLVFGIWILEFHMKVLLLGSGGREHALAWKISQSPLCEKLFIAPGNGGTSQFGENVNIAVSDMEQLKGFCLQQGIDMVVPGSEEPLVKGIYDFFKTDAALAHIPVMGPSKVGAQLEGSKAFAKQFMLRHNIPTAAYREFSEENFEEGVAYLQQHPLPVVLKADGLAAGKGVVILDSREEAITEFGQMIKAAKFGEASKKVVVEQFLTGIELSVFVITDGHSYQLLPTAKDYKRIGEGDTGLNTGGMGAISPVPFADKAFYAESGGADHPAYSGWFGCRADRIPGLYILRIDQCRGRALRDRIQLPYGRSGNGGGHAPFKERPAGAVQGHSSRFPGRSGNTGRSACSRHRNAGIQRLPGRLREGQGHQRYTSAKREPAGIPGGYP